RPGLLQYLAQLRHHGLRRAGDDAQVGHLLLEAGDAARVGPAAGGKFDEGAAIVRRAVARRRAPHRVREAGEFALHPAKLLGVRDRPLFAVGDVHLDQITAVLGAGGVARLFGDLVVELPDTLGVGDRGVERDVGIALLRRPDDGLFADHAGNPYARIG